MRSGERRHALPAVPAYGLCLTGHLDGSSATPCRADLAIVADDLPKTARMSPATVTGTGMAVRAHFGKKGFR